MSMRGLTPPEKFWLGLVGYVLAADVYLWRQEQATLSQEFGGWLQSRHGRFACVGVTTLLVGHLFLELPIPGQTNLKKLVTYRRISVTKGPNAHSNIVLVEMGAINKEA